MVKITFRPIQSGLPTYTKTSEDLQIVIEDIKHGSYEVTIEREEFEDYVHIIHLNSNLVFNISMTPIEEELEPVIEVIEDIVLQVIPYQNLTEYDNTKENTYNEITQIGKNGQRRIVYEVTYTNGVETNRVEKSNTVITQPVVQVRTIGTKTPESPVDEGSLYADEIRLTGVTIYIGDNEITQPTFEQSNGNIIIGGS